MDSRHTLSIIAQGSTATRASRVLLNDDEQDFDIIDPNDLPITNLQRRRSSRVCYCLSLNHIYSFLFLLS